MHPHRLALFAGVALCVGCRNAPPPDEPPAAAPVELPVAPSAAPDAARPDPWHFTGQLLGVTEAHVVVLTDQIVSLDIETGALVATATTPARDPVPSFERHLPRLGDDERPGIAVDRLEDAPIYVSGETVVFMRGTDSAATTLVGLDSATLEEAWTLELAYERPVRSCATAVGVVLVPPSPDPARAVNWLGKQTWLREFGDSADKILDFRCDENQLAVLLDADPPVVHTFDAVSGDLAATTAAAGAALVAHTPAPHPTVRQLGADVVGTIP